MKLVSGAEPLQVISSETPLSRAMLGKFEGDEVSIQIAQIRLQSMRLAYSNVSFAA